MVRKLFLYLFCIVSGKMINVPLCMHGSCIILCCNSNNDIVEDNIIVIRIRIGKVNMKDPKLCR